MPSSWLLRSSAPPNLQGIVGIRRDDGSCAKAKGRPGDHADGSLHLGKLRALFRAIACPKSSRLAHRPQTINSPLFQIQAPGAANPATMPHRGSNLDLVRPSRMRRLSSPESGQQSQTSMPHAHPARRLLSPSRCRPTAILRFPCHRPAALMPVVWRHSPSRMNNFRAVCTSPDLASCFTICVPRNAEMGCRVWAWAWALSTGGG
jgi:hypothetical protein